MKISKFAAVTVIFTMLFSFIPIPVAANTATRYEAQNAERITVGTETPQLASSALASGGEYVRMNGGTLRFTVNAAQAGMYTLRISYANTTANSNREQNFLVNGSAVGVVVFPITPNPPKSFAQITALSAFRLNAGSNTIDITRNWGWIDVDYIEIAPFVSVPFNISPLPVNPNASVNTREMYNFLHKNFGNKVISGVMTLNVTNGNTPLTDINTQEEIVFIRNASGKTPALIGFDFMHGTGRSSDQQWFRAYNNGMLNLAEDLYNRGGIPIFAWHWKDPSLQVESGGFYTENTNFDIRRAVQTGTSEHTAVMRDIDIVAGYLKQLADKDIPVLWRPLHEAAGRWFWWGAHGPEPNKQLWHIMYNRLTNHHGLDNLIWVWTCEEGSDSLDWYPGDAFVDIIGRDFYYYPEEKNHSSLVGSFNNLRELYGGRKLIALAENGSLPYPENMLDDGAMWSWIMPWYGGWTGIGSSVHNVAADWNRVMNHSGVITLEDMPGWGNFTVPSTEVSDIRGLLAVMFIFSIISVTLWFYICTRRGKKNAKFDIGV
jgi:mannan endo-1,4-beta-mannosidase